MNLTSLKLNYEEAKSKCSHFDERASLISLRTRLDLTALKEYNNKPHWIGGKFDLTKMEWVWNDGKTINWGIFGNFLYIYFVRILNHKITKI